MKTFSVLDLPIHLSDNYEDLLLNRIENSIGTHVVTMNSEMAMMAQKNEELSYRIKNADLVIPDGSGIIIYLRRRGHKQHRLAGIELAESLVKQLAMKGEDYPICFYGASVGVTDKA